MDELEKVKMDSMFAQSDRRKDIIIGLLIFLLFLEGIGCYLGHIWYVSNTDYVVTEGYETDVEVSTEGDNASAEYNDVEGNQYNDSATHSEVVE